MLMKTLRPMLIAIAALTLTGGCRKEEDDTPGGGPTPVVVNPLRQLFADNRANATQTFTVQAGQGGTLFAADGIVINIQPNAFRTNSGGMVSGPVNVQVLAALRPGDMVWLNMQTVALYGGEKRMLQSGGELRVRAEAGGEQVTVVEQEVSIHFPADALDPLMQRFVGMEDNDGDVVWQADGPLEADTAGIFVMDSVGGPGWIPGSYYSTPWPANEYDTTWPNYGYINCDHPCPPGGDSTDVTITVPAGFGGWGGSTVWIVLPELNCMVFMEVWNGDQISAGFPLRVGLEGTIVALSQVNGVYRSSFTPITITQNHQQTIMLEPTTLAQYQLDLQGL